MLQTVFIAVFLPHTVITIPAFKHFVRFASVEIDCIMGVFPSFEAAQKRYELKLAYTNHSSRGIEHLCLNDKDRYIMLLERKVMQLNGKNS